MQGIRFPQDQLADIDAFAAEHGMTRAEAVRVLARNGLRMFRIVESRHGKPIAEPSVHEKLQRELAPLIQEAIQELQRELDQSAPKPQA